jgi:hypothetical protein
MQTFRVFYLSLFVIAITAMLTLGWLDGEPWTAAAFAVLLYSRVWRALIIRPFSRPTGDDPVRRANRFIGVTAAGWLGSGVLASGATLMGEGAEWVFVAPLFLIIGALNLWIVLARRAA